MDGFRAPIIFGYVLSEGDLPYSKAFMKFGYPEPSKKVFLLLKLLFVREVFHPVHKGPPYEILAFLMNFIFI